MNEIKHMLTTALKTLSLPNNVFIECDDALAEEIISKVKKIFVEGNPRVWWLSLKYSCEYFDYPKSDGYKHLLEHVPSKKERYWFIPDTEEEALLVFDVEAKYVEQVLKECFYFEYYLVSKKYNWLLADTEHNQIIISRIPINSENISSVLA